MVAPNNNTNNNISEPATPNTALGLPLEEDSDGSNGGERRQPQQKQAPLIPPLRPLLSPSGEETTSSPSILKANVSRKQHPLQQALQEANAPQSPPPQQQQQHRAASDFLEGALQDLLQGEEEDSSTQRRSQQNLEERVAELEAKLSTLTHLLQKASSSSRGRPPRRAHSPLLMMPPRSVSPNLNDNGSSRSISPPLAFSPNNQEEEQDMLLSTGSLPPYTPPPQHYGTTLDSSSPGAGDYVLCEKRRRLSHVLLYSEGDYSTPPPQQQHGGDGGNYPTLLGPTTTAAATPAALSCLESNPALRNYDRLSTPLLEENNDTDKNNEQEQQQEGDIKKNKEVVDVSVPPNNTKDIAAKTSPTATVKRDSITSNNNNNNNTDNNNVRTRWLDYLNTFQESTPDVDLQMEEFVRVPSQVEYLLLFGYWICVDCFLYVLTILPIRFVWSCFLLISSIVSSPNAKKGRYRFHRRHLYQFIQAGIILFEYNYVLGSISIGVLYHWIRGQVMLKLYLLIAIVEVFDRLLCSLGQDCLDSLYWNTTRRPRSARMLVSMSVVLIYVTIHTLFLFVHVATLNVAMNSSDQALLSLLIGGNFAEIKSTVFKKYNKQHLFKITASDICERFKLSLFISLVLILNLCQGMDSGMMYDFLCMCAVVWCAELLSDWIKHSFITKFNYIKSSVYPEYALLLAGDATGIGHEDVNLDHSHAVVKRIGLAQIPLVCVMLRYLAEATRYGRPLLAHLSTSTISLSILGLWFALLVLKGISGSMLQKVAQRKLENAPEIIKQQTPSSGKKKKKKE